MTTGNSKIRDASDTAYGFDAVPLGPAVGSLDEVYISNGFERQRCPATDVRVPRRARLLVRGWAADHRGNRPSRFFYALLDGRRTNVEYGRKREDVATAMGGEAMLETGFRIVVDTSALADGEHELRIRTCDDGSTRELANVRFAVVPQVGSAGLRPLATDLFACEIRAFHGINSPPSMDARVERRFVALVQGHLREKQTKAPASALTGIVDGFEAVTAQLGYRSASETSDGFVLCFSTDDLSIGSHTLDLVATSAGDELQCVASLTFSVVPVCCGPAEPIGTSEIADAAIAWSDSPKNVYSGTDVASFRGWAIDPITRDAIGSAYVRFADGRAVAVTARQFREDVSATRDPAKARFCGFVGSIDFGTFEHGSHCGQLFVISKDRMRLHPTRATLTFNVGRHDAREASVASV